MNYTHLFTNNGNSVLEFIPVGILLKDEPKFFHRFLLSTFTRSLEWRGFVVWSTNKLRFFWSSSVSVYLEESCKIGVFRNIPWKAFVLESLFQKETSAEVFSCEYCQIFKNSFFYRTPPVAASVSYKGHELRLDS